MKRSRLGLFILAGFIVIVVVGPLIIPFPDRKGIEPLDNLIYPDSKFINIDGIDIHYREIQKEGSLILLLHGYGSSTYSWEKVMVPLSQFGTVVAYDQPAFGLTERINYDRYMEQNPYSFDFQVSMVAKMMDGLNEEKAILIGNSAGGTVAMAAVLKYPDRIKAIILVDSAVKNGSPVPSWIQPLLYTPQLNILGPLFVRSIRERGLEILKLAWYDPTKITEDDLLNYQKPLKIPDWDKALWEFTKANRVNDIENNLSEIKIPALIISGTDDKIIPKEQSIWLANEIENSELVLIPECGHVPQEECPQEFLNAVSTFLTEIK